MSEDPKDDVKDVAPVTEPEKVNPAPDVTPPPVTPAHETDSDLRGLVSELAEKVESLTGMVAGLVEKGDPDTTPVKGPWTERRIF